MQHFSGDTSKLTKWQPKPLECRYLQPITYNRLMHLYKQIKKVHRKRRFCYYVNTQQTRPIMHSNRFLMVAIIFQKTLWQFQAASSRNYRKKKKNRRTLCTHFFLKREQNSSTRVTGETYKQKYNETDRSLGRVYFCFTGE